MTSEELIEEGRRIQRRTILLTPDGSGDPAAIWYGHDYKRAARRSPVLAQCQCQVHSVIRPARLAVDLH
jgi:hypothetical protein